jgi:GntR family transcriptional regulator
MSTHTSEALIDRMSATPYYQQLSDLLESRIATQQIEAGARLPSENDLCIEFGLSRATVRQALQLLETRGYATRVNGRGVYAIKPKSSHGWMIQGVEGFLENAMGHQNRAVSTQVLVHGTETLPGFACASLNLPAESEGYVLTRLRCLDGKPALYSINYSPPFLIATIEAADQVLAGKASFSELAAKAGYALGGASRTIRAVAANGDMARHLQIKKGAALLHIRSISWTTEGQRFDIYDTWVCSDTLPLEVNVSTVSTRP